MLRRYFYIFFIMFCFLIFALLCFAKENNLVILTKNYPDHFLLNRQEEFEITIVNKDSSLYYMFDIEVYDETEKYVVMEKKGIKLYPKADIKDSAMSSLINISGGTSFSEKKPGQNSKSFKIFYKPKVSGPHCLNVKLAPFNVSRKYNFYVFDSADSKLEVKAFFTVPSTIESGKQVKFIVVIKNNSTNKIRMNFNVFARTTKAKRYYFYGGGELSGGEERQFEGYKTFYGVGEHVLTLEVIPPVSREMKSVVKIRPPQYRRDKNNFKYDIK